MATYYGTFEDANGNIYCPSCGAGDVQMSNGSTAEDAISNISSTVTAINTSVTSMNTLFNTVLSSSSSS